MFKEISWKEYWTLILLLATVYYIFVFLIFYQKEIALLVKGKKNAQLTPEAEPLFSSAQICNDTFLSPAQTSLFEEDSQVSANIYSDNEDETINEEDNDLHEINLIPYAHELADEIKQLFEKAREKRYVKEELLFSLKEIIKAYQQLKRTSYQNDINNLIFAHSETYCSIHLNADEVATVWLN
jgi:hypothetical protein